MRERIPRMAIEMKRFIDAYRYAEWIDNVSSSFDFGNFAVGLE